MVRNDEHAKRLIDKREQANKKGLPNAVKRYMKRTGFNPNPPVLNGDMQNLPPNTSIYFELLGLQSKRWAASLFYKERKHGETYANQTKIKRWKTNDLQ